MINDPWGVTAGFRQSNAWLAVLTGNLLPPTFLRGDAWGSFNSLAWLGTGPVGRVRPDLLAAAHRGSRAISGRAALAKCLARGGNFDRGRK
ncbi:hypothetical protein [Candidatus Amarobacter glycogenicus]|uniref:hypothetical protein n=1 Tax=Candidatus Amarobacter glycogenicus TaxID=3140699 RepID=UPI002A107A68|nr:hypothetical protein [Dehalococcoidia bacterium]